MGRARRRTEIKLIEAPTSRQVTFLNRQRGLFKKADELTVLCNAEVAVIVFSCTGKLYKYSNCGLKHTIRRYEKETGLAMGSPDQRDVEELQSVINLLESEITGLKMEYTRLTGGELDGLSFEELQQIECQLKRGLLSVRQKKEGLFLEEPSKSRRQEDNVEGEALLKELRRTTRKPPKRTRNQKGKSPVLSAAQEPPTESGPSDSGPDVALRLNSLASSGNRRRRAVEIDG